MSAPFGSRPGRPSEVAPGPPTAAASRIDWRERRPDMPRVLAIAGTGSNAGKTWLAAETIRHLKERGLRVAALKVTRAHVQNCPREIDACGVCDSLSRPFELITDSARLGMPEKDSGRYVAAGADQVLWLLVQPAALLQGLEAVLAACAEDHHLVAEGNSFLEASEVDTSVLVFGSGKIKPSATPLIARVDAFAYFKPAAQSLATITAASHLRSLPILPSSAAATWLTTR